MQFLETTFAPLVMIFTVSNLAAMGLQVSVPEVVVAMRNKKALVLIFVWGWVVGPAFGYLITRVLPLAEPYVVVVLLASLAPCAPFLQQMVGKARGNMGFAGALIPLVAVGTVVLMPLMAPLLIKGLTISTWALAKPLLLTILLPLVIGAAIRHFSDSTATRIFPVVKGLALLSTLATIVWCLVLYGQGMLNTAGQLALLSMTLFMVGMGADHVSDWLRPEAEPAERHGAGDGDTKRGRGPGGGPGDPECGPAHRGDGCHVDLVVGCFGGDWSQNLRQTSRQGRCGRRGMKRIS